MTFPSARAFRSCSLLVLLSGCTSLQSVSVTQVPADRSRPLRAEVTNTALLGIHFDNDFLDDLTPTCSRQCPRGRHHGAAHQAGELPVRHRADPPRDRHRLLRLRRARRRRRRRDRAPPARREDDADSRSHALTMRAALSVAGLALLLLASGCTYSMHEYAAAGLRRGPHCAGPRDRPSGSTPTPEQHVVLGVTDNTDYVDRAYASLLSQCPGDIVGLNTRYSTSLGFLSFKNVVEMRALCLRIPRPRVRARPTCPGLEMSSFHA